MTRTEPDYVVIRLGAGVSSDVVPESLVGMWFDRSEMFMSKPGDPPARFNARPAGRFEIRDDGAVAEVFEITSE